MWLSSCTPACRASTLWRTMEPDSSWRWCHSCVLLHLQTCKCGPKKKFHTIFEYIFEYIIPITMWLSSCTPACRASTLWRTMEPDSSWRWCHSCVLLHLQTCKCGPKKKFHTARHCMSDQTIITHTHNTQSVRQMICSFSTWQKKIAHEHI